MIKIKNTLKEANFPETFIKFFLKQGKIKNAEVILKQIFDNLFYKTSLGEYSILTKIYKTLYINFELRKIKKYRSTHLVLIPINKNRRYFLIIKSLFAAIKEDKRRVSIATKLTTEILKYVKNQDSESLKMKILTKNLASKNRSNAHYRWY